MVKKLKAVVCVAMLAMSTQGVSADDLHVAVRFGDLDLARTEGAAALYGRIRYAARSVCASLDGRSLSEGVNFRTCVGDAIERAVAEANRPTLTDYYQSTLGTNTRIRMAVASR